MIILKNAINVEFPEKNVSQELCRFKSILVHVQYMFIYNDYFCSHPIYPSQNTHIHSYIYIHNHKHLVITSYQYN